MGVRRLLGVMFTLVCLGVMLVGTVPSAACAIPLSDTIAGYLVEPNTGELVAGADVILSDGSNQWHTTSDASGAYTFSGMPVGNYSVWAEKVGYFLDTGWSANLDGTVGVFQILNMYQDVLQGHVTCNGEPVFDAYLVLYSRSSPSDPWELQREFWTSTDGYYHFNNISGAEWAIGFPGGRAQQLLLKPCYYDGASSLESATPFSISLATTKTIDLPMAQIDPSIAGKVTKADGSPAAGVEVWTYVKRKVGWSGREVTRTAGDGAYAFYLDADEVYRVGVPASQSRSVCTLPAFYSASGPSVQHVESASDVTVVCTATASCDIRLSGSTETLTRDAYEVDDVQSQAKPVTVGGPVQSHTLLPAGDDDWMSFQVIAGHTYAIETTAHPTLPYWSYDTMTHLGLYDSDGKTKVSDAWSLGWLHQLARLEWTAPSTKTVYAKVTDVVSFTGGPSERGAYGFRVTDLGPAAETGSLSGRVTDSVTATGVPHAEVILNDDLVCYTDANGYYRFDGLAVGGYSPEVWAGGYDYASASLNIENAGDSVVQDFVLDPSEPANAVIRGYTTGPDGGVPAATVTAVAAGSGATTTTVTDPDGKYSFKQLEPGTYTVTFAKTGYATATYSGVSVDSSETVSRCGYLALLGTVHGSVTTSAGSLAGCSVVIDGAEATKTAADGGYAVGDLSLGVHTLKFSAVGYAPYSQQFAIDDADSLTIDGVLTTQTIAPTKPIVTRTPSKASLTYKRKRGRANFSLGVNVRDAKGARLGGVLVLLQRSYDGKHWTKAYRLMTNASGTATKRLYGTKKQKMYYRWVVTPTSTHKQVVTAKQKVTIK